jgi:hypothetical protein
LITKEIEERAMPRVAVMLYLQAEEQAMFEDVGFPIRLL